MKKAGFEVDKHFESDQLKFSLVLAHPHSEMKDNFETGWLANLSRTFTENFDLRPPNSDVNLIIIHCISLPPGHYGGNFISQFFTNRLDFKADSYFSNLKESKYPLTFT